MRAIKLKTYVAKDHMLNVRLPDDVQEGPAEVIVLVPESGVRRPHSLDEFLERLSTQPRNIRSKEEIDRELESERESWE